MLINQKNETTFVLLLIYSIMKYVGTYLLFEFNYIAMQVPRWSASPGKMKSAPSLLPLQPAQVTAGPSRQGPDSEELQLGSVIGK